MAVAVGKSPGVVRQLVMMFGVNKRDEYNRTPLMFAALGNNKNSSCGTLIECGAETDRQDICGLTALHVACYHGNKAAASVLLSKHASVCLFDKTVSPIQLAKWQYSATSIIRTSFIQNLDYPELVYPEPRLSRPCLSGTSIIRTLFIRNLDYPDILKLTKYTNTHA